MEVLGLSAMATLGLGTLYPPMPPPEASAPLTDSPAVSTDGCSLGSSSCDPQQVQQAADLQQQQLDQDLLPPEQRTHHLLKHCLSHTQRGSALAHFNTSDPREAAKEIARMGQRELQSKFKDVYGSATKSNNNSWLRRKLYEAVGVAPLKATTKGKARKAGGGGHRRAGGSKDSSKARQPKPAAQAAKVKREAVVAAPAPGGPLLGGMSILDLHQHSGLLSADTSDSEDGCASHGNLPAALHSGPDSPRSSLAGGLAPFSCGPALGGAARCGHLALSPGSTPAGFVPMAACSMPPEPQSPMASGLHWADGMAVQQAAPSPFLGADGAAPLAGLDGCDASLASPAAALPALSNPMDLEQDAAQLWGCDAQPWYFGTAMDLGPTPAVPPFCLPVDSGDAADTCCAGDDDDIPLLTLDLGAIDVSI